MTRIQIVDDQDNLIGHVERSKIDYSKDIYRITAVWVTNSAGQVLMAQRTLTKDKDPGMWGPAVAGTMDEGETYEENVYKELEEEIGISSVELQKGPYVKYETPRMCFCQWYLLTIDKLASDFKIQEEEVEQVAWMDPADLVADQKANPKKYTPSMAKIIKQFIGASDGTS